MTMIMMTDPERRNSEPFKSGHLNQQVKNTLENAKHYSFEDLNQRHSRCLPSAHVSCQKVAENGQPPREKLVLSLDDGYGTDSRSTTTASISSPLSSSLSSLSTYEGSPIGTGSNILALPHQELNSAAQFAMQRSPIEKGPSVVALSRSSMNKHNSLHAKRRDVQMESPETTSNLEDRLRALTTIEEEDSAFPDRNRNRYSLGHYANDTLARLSHSLVSSPRDLRFSRRTTESSELTSGNEAPELNTSGYFRAVPVQVNDGLEARHVDSEMESMPQAMFPSYSKSPLDGWKDYSTYFQKDTEIPLHNIDPAGRGKFTNASVDDVPDMDINRQIGTGAPNITKSQLRFNHDVDYANHVVGQSKSVPPSPGQQRSLGQHRSMGAEDSSQYPPYNINHKAPLSDNVQSTGNNSRQRRIMSSMPDLRAYEPPSTWQTEKQPPSLPYQPPNYTSSHPEQQQYEWYRQNQELPADRQEPHYQHIYETRQQQVPSAYQHQQGPQSKHPPDLSQQYHQLQSQWQPPTQTNRYVNLQPQYASAIDVSNTGSYLRDNPYRPAENQSSFNYPEVVLRRTRHSGSPSTAPPRLDRYSWQPESLYGQEDVENRMKTVQERSSLDLGSIPQLQRQIRATSELCLQASRRHMFASSADIYKLFSGQKKGPVPSSPVTPRHTITTDHKAMSASKESLSLTQSGQENSLGNPYQNEFIPESAQHLPRTKPKLRIVMPPSNINLQTSSPGPIRPNHPLVIPPESWVNVASMPNESRFDSFQQRSFSAQGDFSGYQRPMNVDEGTDNSKLHRPANMDIRMDKSLYYRHPSADLEMEKSLYQRPTSVELKMDKSMYHRPPSAELRTDKHLYHRPTSTDLRSDNHSFHRSFSTDLGMDTSLYQSHPSADIGVAKASYNRPSSVDQGIDKQKYQRSSSVDLGTDKNTFQTAFDTEHSFHQRQPNFDLNLNTSQFHGHSSFDQRSEKAHLQKTPTLDPGLDRPTYHRQSSGYSSETELQQIEFNAVKRSKHRQERKPHKDNDSEEFVPLNRSLDSNTCTDQTDEPCEEEPVYVNLTRGKASDALNRSSSSSGMTLHSAGDTSGNVFPPSNVLSYSAPAPGISHQSNVASHLLGEEQHSIRLEDHYAWGAYHANDDPQYAQLKNASLTTGTGSQKHGNQEKRPFSSNGNALYSNLDKGHCNNQGHIPYTSQNNGLYNNQDQSHYSNIQARPANERPLFPDMTITQKQVINFNKKPVTITSLVPQFAYEDAHQSEPHSNEDAARPNYPLTPHVSVLQDHPVNPPHHSEQRAAEFRPHANGRRAASAVYSNDPGRGSPSVRPVRQPQRPGSSSHQLSPAIIAQLLDTPFATNIISDEQGDKLSTLV